MAMLITYRYLIKEKNDNQIKVKIVTETDEGHRLFVESVIQQLKPERFAREYVCEYDCSKIMLVTELSGGVEADEYSGSVDSSECITEKIKKEGFEENETCES